MDEMKALSLLFSRKSSVANFHFQGNGSVQINLMKNKDDAFVTQICLFHRRQQTTNNGLVNNTIEYCSVNKHPTGRSHSKAFLRLDVKFYFNQVVLTTGIE